jgi:hypothetical protein
MPWDVTICSVCGAGSNMSQKMLLSWSRVSAAAQYQISRATALTRA